MSTVTIEADTRQRRDQVWGEARVLRLNGTQLVEILKIRADNAIAAHRDAKRLAEQRGYTVVNTVDANDF